MVENPPAKRYTEPQPLGPCSATAMPGVQPVTVESRAGIQSRGLGYEPSWSCILAGWGWGDDRRILPVSKWLITTFRVVPVPNSIYMAYKWGLLSIY